MNICIISGFKENSDEGMKIIAEKMARELSKDNAVLHVNLRQKIFSRKFWIMIKEFQPNIIHFYLRPNFVTLSLLKIFGLYCKNARLVISSLQPPQNIFLPKILISHICPHLILAQSAETYDFFNSAGCNVQFFPSGVDLKKFYPVDPGTKKKLREKYDIDKEKIVLLHVGHINRGRNLQVFKDLLSHDKKIESLIIGSTNKFNFDQSEYDDLERAGVIIKREYFEKIEEIYQLSDCYIFPTINKSFAIEIPLSILEAMACNLRVVSTKYGGLTRIFKNNDGIHFVDSIEEIPEAIEKILSVPRCVLPRDKVLEYSWENQSKNLIIAYRSILPEVV